VSALATLLARARVTHSDAVVVRRHDEVISAWYNGLPATPILTMSCTKSIVSLAIGALLDDRLLPSIDQPVCEIYPEWRQGDKQRITLRHLLTHTSGVQDHPNAGLELEPSPDWVQLALAAELSERPGERYRYNNKAVNLLAGIVQRAAHQPLDTYLQERILTPLGITDVAWVRDQVGAPYVAGGLSLLAGDLAKLGQLVLNRGLWAGQRILSEDWVALSLAQGQPYYPLYGLLWWRVPAYEHVTITAVTFAALQAAGVTDATLHALESLVEQRFASAPVYRQALARALGPDWQGVLVDASRRGVELATWDRGEIIGYQANGYLGQYLVILPDAGIVAVRLVRRSPTYDPATDVFEDFAAAVHALSGEKMSRTVRPNQPETQRTSACVTEERDDHVACNEGG